MIYLIILFSLIIGSFLNVCIYRIPRGESIVYPPSHCTKCGTRLKVYDLIPIISYIITRGKCRYCGERISSQYPMVELFNGFLSLMLYLRFGFNLIFFKYALLLSILIVIAFIDYHHRIIPDKILIFGTIAGILLSSLYNFPRNFLNGTMGLIIGGGIFLIIALVTKGAMGGGDIKLMAMIGLCLGWRHIILITLLSFIIGALISLILIIFHIKSKKDYIPFAPFISLAAVISIFFGSEIIRWYWLLFS